MQSESSVTTTPAPGLFSREYLWTTIGSCALVFLGAFESLAVTTVMPVVSAELHGASLYALAFAGPLATGVIGMVIAGNWSDRGGPIAPLYTSSVLFIFGLIIAGTATGMPTLVIGRLVQGFGSGAIIVALYVVVARVFPARLHPAIFAGFAASWVIPSLIGPFAAGAITEHWGWRWVFLAVVGLIIAAMAMVVPVARGVKLAHGETLSTPWSFGRIVWAIVAASAVLSLDLMAKIPALGGLLAGCAAVLVIVAARPLLPRGTLLTQRGLPSVILLRGLTAASFFGAEVYLPYMLVENYRFTPTLAGLALTLAALSWAGASWLQGRMSVSLTNAMSTGIGTSLVLVAILTVFATSLLTLSPEWAIAGWALGGGGMGLMYPRISVMTLAMSSSDAQGFNSSALAIADSLGSALALATAGVVFAVFSFTGLFAFTAVVAMLAIVVAPRVAMKGKNELQERGLDR
jgi:MFS family permease